MTFSTIGIAILLAISVIQLGQSMIDKLSSSECTNKGMRVEMKHKQELELAPHESLESHISRESSSKSETPKNPKPKKKKQLLDKKSKSHESNSEIIDIDISEEEAQQDQTDYENNYTEEDTESL